MTPAAYLDLIAEPTLEEAIADPTSVRRVMLACMACHHVMDAFAVVDRRKPEQVYKDFVLEHPGLRVVKAVALVAKHIEPEQRDFANVRTNHIRKAKGAAFSDGSYFSDGSTFSDAREVVTLQSPDFSKADLLHALQDAVAFLRGKATSHPSSAPT